VLPQDFQLSGEHNSFGSNFLGQNCFILADDCQNDGPAENQVFVSGAN
jgi:hypothetical protein